jgi:hypothetical protein
MRINSGIAYVRSPFAWLLMPFEHAAPGGIKAPISGMRTISSLSKFYSTFTSRNCLGSFSLEMNLWVILYME